MITMKKRKTNEIANLIDRDAKPVKAPYTTPTLRTYGAVSQLTAGQNGSNSDKNSQTKKGNSDRTIKENIVRIGTHPLGIGLYLFDYKPEFRELSGFGRRFGVMADEVETVLPQAVLMHPDGFKMVDYALLGIDFPGKTVH